MTTFTITIGTKNPAKINAVEQALMKMDYADVYIEGISVPSNVSVQPFGDEETLQGALNRAIAAQKLSDSSIGIGLEGGVVETTHGLFVCNWGSLYDPSLNEPIHAGGARIRLPDEIANEVRAGLELGPVMQNFSQKESIRQKEGAVGIFTNGRMNRGTMFSHIVELLIGQWEYERMK